jgi:26S proteasome regulatory subunit N9
MKSLSLGLIRGKIDQIDQKMAVTWIQPRVLDVQQVGTLCQLIKGWEDKALELSNTINRIAPELFIQ